MAKPTVDKIRELGLNYENYYRSLRKEQETDQQYYDDKFQVNIKPPYHTIRTGIGRRLVDSPSEHILTSNPQIFRDSKRFTQTEITAALNIVQLLTVLIDLFKKQNPQPIHEFVKNLLLRGEAYFQVISDEENGLPVFPFKLLVPDPMTVYPNPYEENYTPINLIRKYKRLVWAVKARYPEWQPDRPRRDDDSVDWLEYWDEDWRYFEADGQPILSGGVQKNIFGIVPFVHSFSGFGKSSAEGKPESLAVSLLAGCRSLLTEECYVASQLSSIIGLFANPLLILQKPPIQAEGKGEEEKIDLTPGAVLELPLDWKFQIYQGESPSDKLFEHYYQIQRQLQRYLPPVMQGLPSSTRTTGRLEDIMAEQSLVRYETVVENTQYALEYALGKCLKILTTVPSMLPVSIRAKDEKGNPKEEKIDEKDIGDNFSCKVLLKAPNPLTEDRLMMAGRALNPAPGQGLIDWRTNLVKYQGFTEVEAEKIIVRQIADTVIFSPPVISVVAKEIVDRLGLGKMLEEAMQQTQMTEQAGKTSPEEMAGTRGAGGEGEPRTFNAQNPAAAETIRQLLTQGGVRSTARR